MSLPSPAQRAARRDIRLAALLLVLAVVAAYSNSFHGPFVYDDVQSIPENPSIRQLWPLTDVLFPKLEGGLTVSGRPLLNFSFAVNHALSGEAVWSYHALNLLIHAGAGLVLFGLVRRTLERRGHARARLAAFAVSALWMLHPLQTEAVTYIVQRAESLVGFFYLLALYAFARGLAAGGDPSKTSRGWFVGCVGAALAGVATKEVAATLPLLVLLYDRTFGAGSFAAAWRARRGVYLSLGATWPVLALLMASTGGNRGGTMDFTSLASWPAYWATQGHALVRYVALTVWPQPLVFDYDTFWLHHTLQWLPTAACMFALLGGTIVALRRRPAAGFCGAWFFLILAPTSLAPGKIQMIVEHRAYLPLAGLIVLGVVVADARAGRRALAATLMAALACGALTFRRNQDYRSGLVLWGDTVAKRPDNARAHGNLADALGRARRFEEAIAHATTAAQLQPEQAKYRYNLGLAFADAQRWPEAVAAYEEALRLAPGEPATHNNLAIALVQIGQPASALPHSAVAVRLAPKDAGFRFNHGVALARNGRWGEAIAAYEEALRLRPDYTDAHVNLAAALVQERQFDAALQHYTVALQLNPTAPEIGISFAGALLLAGRAAEARTEFTRVLQLHPDSLDARFGLGDALATLGQPDAAVAHYEAVLAREQAYPGARFKLGNALVQLNRPSEAIAQYQAAVQQQPNDAEAHHNLGVACARLERYAEARTEFETALRLRPDYAAARQHLEQLRQIGR